MRVSGLGSLNSRNYYCKLGILVGLYRNSIGIICGVMDENMETIVVYRDYFGILRNDVQGHSPNAKSNGT